MFYNPFKKSESNVIKKCERELEVKYTKLLTMEFCISWATMHAPKPGQDAVLSLNTPKNEGETNSVSEFRLDLIENYNLRGDAKSQICCLIFALDVEPSLKKLLAAGNGSYILQF